MGHYAHVRTRYGRETRDWNAGEHLGDAEASFGFELSESGHLQEAAEAFEKAEERGVSFDIIGEGNAKLVLARARALDAVGRHAEATALREEAEAVRARSDYVEAALLTQGEFAIVARWTVDEMPLRVQIAKPNHTVVREPDAAVRLVRSAIRSWSDATGSGVRFRFVRNPREADIRVQWDHDQNYARIIGLCKPRATWDDDPLNGAKVILVTRLMGQYLSDDQVRHVAIHEMGHALGLLGHSSREDDVMYPSVADGHLTEPSERDVRTLRRLYKARLGQSYNP